MKWILSWDPKFNDLYKGHMVPVTALTFPKGFIPHNGAFNNKGDPQTIQITFDASVPTTSDVSWKELLLMSPEVQALVSSNISFLHDQL